MAPLRAAVIVSVAPDVQGIGAGMFGEGIMFNKTIAALIALSIAHGFAIAQEVKAGDIVVNQAFARATPPCAMAGGAFFKIENKGKASDRLLAVASPAAGMAELHTMTHEGGVMRMRAVDAIEIKPGETVALAPGGLHVMLMDLKQPLKEGSRFPLTLTFERAGKVRIEVSVGSMAAKAAAEPMHTMH
jgi:copper(I)-binding protein